MPSVPTYDGPQVRSNNLQTPMQGVPDVSSGLQSVARGLQQVGDAADKIGLQIDTQKAFDAEVAIKGQWLAKDAELRKQFQGANAPGYQAEVDKFWTDARAALGTDLSPRAQAIVGKSLGVAALQAQASGKAFIAGEVDRSQQESFIASQNLEIQRAAASGDPAVAVVSSKLLRERNAQQAAIKGLTPEQLAEMNTRATTALHTQILQGLQQKDPTAAMAYFTANKGEIDGTRHAEIERGLTTAVAGTDGMRAAGEIWMAQGPKADGQPVELDKMEAAARERFANDPARRDATIAQLRERAAAQNSSERERTAASTNAVMLRYSQGASLATITRMPEFTALPGAEQAKIRQHIEDRAYAAALRANANDARSEAAAARAERELQRKTSGAFLVYSDPNVLGRMSRAEVQALLPALGNDQTKHLTSKWDAMQSADGKTTASIDQQDFDHVAQTMGLKPFDPKKDEGEKAQLGELKYRTEQLIDKAQRAKKAPLTRDEKLELMRGEMARTVTVGGFFSNTEKPVIQLSKDDIANVVVPAAERAVIVEAMKRRGLDPTEENLKRLYLRGKSRAAETIE